MVTPDQLRRRVDTILDTLGWDASPFPTTPTVTFWATNDAKVRSNATTYQVAHSARICGRARLDRHQIPVARAGDIRPCPKCAERNLCDVLDDAVVHHAVALYHRERVGAQRTNAPVATRYELAALIPQLHAHAQRHRPLSALAGALADVAGLSASESLRNAFTLAALARCSYDLSGSSDRYGFVVPGLDMRLFGSQHPGKLWCGSDNPWRRHGVNMLAKLSHTGAGEALSTMQGAVTEAGPPNVGCFDPIILDGATLASATSNGAWLTDVWSNAVDTAFDTMRAWLNRTVTEPAVRVAVVGKPAALAGWLASNDLLVVFHLLAGCHTIPADGRLEYVGPPVVADFLHGWRQRHPLEIEVGSLNTPDAPGPDDVRVANVLWAPGGEHLARYAEALEAAQLVAAA